MRLNIKKLYGRFDYDLEFPDSGVAILTGPNGFGKSTLLRCIRAVGESDLNFFRTLEFSSFEMNSEKSDDSFIIERTNKDEYLINGTAYSAGDLRRYGQDSTGLSTASAQFLQISAEYASYIDRSTNKKKAAKAHDMSPLLEIMQRITGEVFLIEEQRLLKEKPADLKKEVIYSFSAPTVGETVSDIPRELQDLLNQTTREYSAVATRLDSQFLRRLLNRRKKEAFTEADFVEKYADTRQKLDTLRENGISSFPDLGELRYQAENEDAFRIFFDDFAEKYAVYAPLMERMTLFRNTVNRRFRFKSLSYTEKGLVIRDNDSGKPLDLGQLSSGEKEILLLYFQLIFQTEPDMLILVDEPEISLHVAWQRQFVLDLRRIAELNGFSAIIATHSPFISNSVDVVKYDLGELYQGRQDG